MHTPVRITTFARTVARAALATIVLAALLVSAPFAVSPAGAQGGEQVIEVWGIDTGDKEWKYRQSVAGDDLGTANAAALGLDDSAWETRTLHWKEIVGSFNANHFRKTFELSDVLPAGVTIDQVVGIRVQIQYDDTAVMYLNGTEVYRSIRGNLDPDYVDYPAGANFPHNVLVPWGGAERDYINIPDPDMVNTCEIPDEICSASPYGSAHPPEIPVNLLIDGTNTWAISTWNNSNGGSGDSQLDHVFQLIIDENAIPAPQVIVNETMASNDTVFRVQLDSDPELETPDWIELRNIDPNDTIDISGWALSDASATWIFPPGTTVPPNGYLVVAANDKDITTTDPMQTNFKLSASSDFVKLTTPEGIVASDVAWTDQFTDNSFGRPNDAGSSSTYLASPSPGAVNGGMLTTAPPVLRFFRDRMLNTGETVALQAKAFDPDNDSISFSASPLPAGVQFDGATGLFTGTFAATSDMITTLTVTDGDGQSDSQTFGWIAVPPVSQASPLVLNEYNAVPNTGELSGGSPIGNGGDWFEFLVVDDAVDLRGWSLEFRQRDPGSDQLRIQTILTFTDRTELSNVPAGTIITIGQDQPDDLSFNAANDWTIHLQVDGDGNGTFFDPVATGSTFNSTRRDQTVLIRNAAGTIVTPLVGETDGWDAIRGGVSEGEVMNLCRDMQTGMQVNPVNDYYDNGSVSTFGQPNVCVYPDPNDPATLITDPQNLSPLRASASLGTGSGDVNCDGVYNIVDALLIARLEVRIISDTGPCLLDQGGPNHEAAEAAGDVNSDGVTNIVDALVIARCSVGIPSAFCPNP